MRVAKCAQRNKKGGGKYNTPHYMSPSNPTIPTHLDLPPASAGFSFCSGGGLLAFTDSPLTVNAEMLEGWSGSMSFIVAGR